MHFSPDVFALLDYRVGQAGVDRENVRAGSRLCSSMLVRDSRRIELGTRGPNRHFHSLEPFAVGKARLVARAHAFR